MAPKEKPATAKIAAQAAGKAYKRSNASKAEEESRSAVKFVGRHRRKPDVVAAWKVTGGKRRQRRRGFRAGPENAAKTGLKDDGRPTR